MSPSLRGGGGNAAPRYARHAAKATPATTPKPSVRLIPALVTTFFTLPILAVALMTARDAADETGHQPSGR